MDAASELHQHLQSIGDGSVAASRGIRPPTAHAVAGPQTRSSAQRSTRLGSSHQLPTEIPR